MEMKVNDHVEYCKYQVVKLLKVIDCVRNWLYL